LETEVHLNEDNPYDLMFYPDAGAAKKYSELFKFPYRYGNKKRDLKLGEVIGYEVVADEEDINGKKILIIDDICAGGRTFREAASALRKMGAAQIDLYITHMMPQSKAFYEAKGDGLIDNIYTNDSLNIFNLRKEEVITITLQDL
jgi:ribose-phosphate pyrophosphokinase